jgi:hypothetical protein
VPFAPGSQSVRVQVRIAGTIFPYDDQGVASGWAKFGVGPTVGMSIDELRNRVAKIDPMFHVDDIGES